jgi:hypothetical protein
MSIQKVVEVDALGFLTSGNFIERLLGKGSHLEKSGQFVTGIVSAFAAVFYVLLSTTTPDLTFSAMGTFLSVYQATITPNVVDQYFFLEHLGPFRGCCLG